MRILAGDIGGTNTRLLLADLGESGRHILAEKSYPSADYEGFIQVLNTFLFDNEIQTPLIAACFAVAGPVENGVVSVTNLPWVISEEELGNVLQTRNVKLINDFAAVSYGIFELQEDDILILQQGVSGKNRSMNPDAAIIGAGTGLGVSHRVWLNENYQVLSSETGHVGFAPENEQQLKLLAWLQKKYSHVSLEMILSGKGLPTIYQFLREDTGLSESAEINEAMKQGDPAQVITENALSNNDELCQKTLDCFIDIYGASAGNVALNYYPVDELYIAGGIAVKIKDRLKGQRFINAFVNKGLMSSNMEKITIKLITQDKVGLYGALSHALTLPV
jgi:glucokinase